MCCYSESHELSSVAFCLCLRLLNVYLVYIHLFEGHLLLSIALQLCLLHVLFIDRAARDPKQASDVSVRCTRQFKGSDQEIDCEV